MYSLFALIKSTHYVINARSSVDMYSFRVMEFDVFTLYLSVYSVLSACN